MTNNIPDFQTLMLPFLKILGDGKQHTLKEMINRLSEEFKLTEEERELLLPSGNQAIINNRVGWVRTYLNKSGLINVPQRATFIITEEGSKVLSSNPSKIDLGFLRKLPAFQEWQKSYSRSEIEKPIEAFADVPTDSWQDITVTPSELIDTAFAQLDESLSYDIFSKLKSLTDRQFEKIVLKLLTEMGYGSFREDASQHTGKSGDGGIDGLIKEDKLGLDTIYIQVKQYKDLTVPIGNIRDFWGALLFKKAKKGIFITLSSFPASAYDYVEKIEPKVALINGKDLAKLMIEYNVGVSEKRKILIKGLDNDFFDEL
jgi:restriction system protein